MNWTRRHILSLEDFTADEYNTVLQTAASFREVLSRKTKKVPALQGQVVANMSKRRPHMAVARLARIRRAARTQG